MKIRNLAKAFPFFAADIQKILVIFYALIFTVHFRTSFAFLREQQGAAFADLFSLEFVISGIVPNN